MPPTNSAVLNATTLITGRLAFCAIYRHVTRRFQRPRKTALWT
jgi:hypothetical protein